MPVGSATSSDQINNMITSFSVRLRDLMRDIYNLNLMVNGQNTGLAYLEAKGFSSTPNPANPGGVSDAQYALDAISHLFNPAGCYYGTVQQGGTGGTGAILFNFDQYLSQFWAGQ
jgi:hypothetical protein